MAEKFKIPDWRDITNYPDAKTTYPTRWAWEFLRRNKEYRADWSVYENQLHKIAAKERWLKPWLEWRLTRDAKLWSKLEAKIPDKATFDKEFERAMVTLDDDELAWLYDPPKHEQETESQYSNRVANYTSEPLVSALGERWGLKDIANPIFPTGGFLNNGFTKTAGSGPNTLNLDRRSMFRDDLQKRYEDLGLNWHEVMASDAIRQINELGEKYGKPYFEAVILDLRYPIDPQMERMRKAMLARQRGKVRRSEIELIEAKNFGPTSGANHQRYLRAHDATETGASIEQIVNVLLPNERNKNTHADGKPASKKVTNWLREAERLIQGGYLSLALATYKKAPKTNK